MPQITDVLKSSVFHAKQKGCRIVWYGFPRGKDLIVTIVDQINGDAAKTYLKKGTCKTHHVPVCHCGFEIGTHGGVISPGYKPPESSL